MDETNVAKITLLLYTRTYLPGVPHRAHRDRLAAEPDQVLLYDQAALSLKKIARLQDRMPIRAEYNEGFPLATRNMAVPGIRVSCTASARWPRRGAWLTKQPFRKPPEQAEAKQGRLGSGRHRRYLAQHLFNRATPLRQVEVLRIVMTL